MKMAGDYSLLSWVLWPQLGPCLRAGPPQAASFARLQSLQNAAIWTGAGWSGGARSDLRALAGGSGGGLARKQVSSRVDSRGPL